MAERFFNGFTGSVTTDSYNVYKLFERKDSSITRYACMTHVRCKFVEVLQNDDRFSEIVNLISELYWVNRITRFVSYQKRSDDSVRFRYLARFGNELNLYLMRLAIMPQLCFWKRFVMPLTNGKLYAAMCTTAGLRLIIMRQSVWWSLSAWDGRTICFAARRRLLRIPL